MKASKTNVLLMLRESNAIEAEYDPKELIQARRAWDYINLFDTINNMIVKETHRILMKHQSIEYRHKGDWRDIPVTIGGEVKAQPKIVIDSLMRDLTTDINNDMFGDPIVYHKRFENIHPFVDGNGRMGRIIMNWQAVKSGRDLIVFTEAKKEDYYKLFRRVRV